MNTSTLISKLPSGGEEREMSRRNNSQLLVIVNRRFKVTELFLRFITAEIL